ncbi:hypothetical protein [Kyrpidia tusciae]|uniref:hypothetical protein n=1 Tax=Kyrpidia tusciae TaxID=33943 RepID=UPI00059E43FC|nr:hypothetical protein [Kyrpidia tusciae]
MKWAKVRRNLETPEIADLEGVGERETSAVLGQAFGCPLRVAITAGSRGIFGIDRTLRKVVQTVRSFGGGSSGGRPRVAQRSQAADAWPTDRSARPVGGQKSWRRKSTVPPRI